MFQFTTETIINSNVDSSGATKFFANGTTFSVLRAGNFKKAEVVSVFKTAASAAVKEKLITTITGTPVVGQVYRLALDIKLSGSANSEFANDFVIRSKRFWYEVKAATTSTTDLATLFKAAVLKEATTTGFSLFTLTSSGAVITLEAGTEYQRFLKAEIQTLTDGTSATPSGAMLTGYDNYTVFQDLLGLTTAGSYAWTKGKQGFGTTTWLTKNLRLPTIDRTNYTAIGQEELPQAGATYNQYAIRSAIKSSHTGMGTVGQEMTSIVTAIFYVISTAVSAFESAMTTAGLTILNSTTGAGALTLNYVDDTIFVGDNTIPTIVGAIGVVTYESATVGKATVDADTGVVTAVAAGTSVITATDTYTGGTQEATFTVTVLALA
jgi:hypothetical protein